MRLLFKLITLTNYNFINFFFIKIASFLNSIYAGVQIGKPDYVLYEDVRIIINPYKLNEPRHEIV